LFTGIEELLTSHGDRVRVIFRHYPLEQHAMAYRAALAAEAARAQGKFWEYATLLFANQTSLTEAKLLEFASQVGLDRARFEASLARKDSALLVESDLDAGARVGVRGTPAVFVNGQPVADNSPAGVKAAVEAALARPR
jgi:protein-disulfide isomerase